MTSILQTNQKSSEDNFGFNINFGESIQTGTIDLSLRFGD